MIFLLLPILAFAAGRTEVYHYVYGGRKIEMPVLEVEGVKVNDLCAKGCQALKVYKGKGKTKDFSGAKQGAFASTYCERLGGTPLLATKEGEANLQFCVFDDLSAIEAEKLLTHHLEGKQ